MIVENESELSVMKHEIECLKKEITQKRCRNARTNVESR